MRYREKINDEILDSVSLYLCRIKKFPFLDKKEEHEINIKDKLVLSNLPFVVWVAKQYIWSGISMADLIALGNVGLVKASRKFDGNRDTGFRSYAIHWIKQVILIAIKKKDIIALPIRVKQEVIKYEKALKTLMLFQRNPFIEEIAVEMGTSVEKVKKIQEANYKILSLEFPIANSFATMADMIEDEKVGNPEKEAIMKDMIAKIFSKSILKSREKEILKMRFGIDGKERKTLANIAEMLHVSKARVQMIEKDRKSVV